MKKRGLIGVLLLFSICTVAQNNSNTPKDSTKHKVDFIFSAGGGTVRYMGDVQDASEKVNVHVLGNRPALDINLGLSLSRSFTLNLNTIYGKLSGNENTFKQHRNFESEMVLAGLNVEYNFAGAWKKRIPVLNPFITVGAYYSNYFNINTDLLHADGTPYHYWSDGKIRGLPETEDNHELNLPPLKRDYEYETSLIDGGVHSFTASAGIGLDLHLSRALSVRLLSRYFFATTDKVDGHYKGDAAGMSDGFFFNQLSLVVNTMAFSKSRKGELPAYRFIFDPSQLQAVEEEDTDGDGIADMADACANTPTGITVDAQGCPIDTDGDGIPDYRDKEKHSNPEAIVDRDGVAIDYKIITTRKTDTLGVNRIQWTRNYITGTSTNKPKYTVNVKTVKTGSEKLLNPAIGSIKELKRSVINDSLILFTLGIYDHFEDAEAKSIELDKLGENQTYGVKESRSSEVAVDLHGLNKNIDTEQVQQSYAIRESLNRIRDSRAYQNPSFSYAMERIAAHLNEAVPEYLLVKDFLSSTASYTSDMIVSESRAQVRSKLDEFPINDKPTYIVAGTQTSAQNTEETTHKAAGLPYTMSPEFQKLSPLPSQKTRVSVAPVKPAFKAADYNKDQFISSSEIEKTMKNILEGNSQITVAQFNDMVQYYTYYTGNADPIDFGGTEVVIVDGVLSILKRQDEDFSEESRKILAKKYKEADFNADGVLAPEEVQKMINLFMQGKSSYSSERVYELVDLYFD